MRTLVFWGDGPLARARARAAEGVRVLLWGQRSALPPDALLPTADFGPAEESRIEEATRNWVDRLAEQPSGPGRPFRDLFAWEQAPLFPQARRFFISAESIAGRCVRLIEAFRVVLEKELPDEVEAFGLLEDEVRLLERSCTARGVLFQGGTKSCVARAGQGLRGGSRPGLADRVRALRSALPAAKPKLPGRAVVFVRPEEPSENAQALERLRRVAAEELAMRVVALGGEEGPAPEVFLDEAGRQAVRQVEAALEKLCRELGDTPSVAAAFVHDDVRFADLAAASDLEALLLERLPRAVRRAEGVRSVLRQVAPPAMCALREDTLAHAAARVQGVLAVPFADPRNGPEVLQALEAATRGNGMVG